jgi:hypothetical protein
MVSRELEKECIVVFDEAHNIDNVCIEALSVNLRQQTLAGARRNIAKLEKVEGRRVGSGEREEEAVTIDHVWSCPASDVVGLQHMGGARWVAVPPRYPPMHRSPLNPRKPLPLTYMNLSPNLFQTSPLNLHSPTPLSLLSNLMILCHLTPSQPTQTSHPLPLPLALQSVKEAQAATRQRLDSEYRRLVEGLVEAGQLAGGEEWLANPALPDDIVRESVPGGWVRGVWGEGAGVELVGGEQCLATPLHYQIQRQRQITELSRHHHRTLWWVGVDWAVGGGC